MTENIVNETADTGAAPDISGATASTDVVRETAPVQTPDPKSGRAQTTAQDLANLVDIEPSQTTSNAKAAHSREPARQVFNALDAELGDLEELKHDGFYDKIDESHIKDLPSTARRILHNFRVDRKMQESRHAKEMGELKTSVEERERNLMQLERDFARRQAEFSAVLQDPKVRDVLNRPNDELPDLFSEEGIHARIERGIAQGLQRVLEPMQQASAAKSQQSAYLDFIEKHPEMRDASFKKDMAGLVRTRQEGGTPISTQDAYQIVKARRVLAKQQARSAKETKARQESARNIRSASSSGSPSKSTIPPEVKKRGATAIAKWLQSNPEAARAIRSRLHS